MEEDPLEDFIRSFVPPDLRSRLVTRVRTSPKTRRKYLRQFDHFTDLDSRYAEKIKSPSADQIVRTLRAKGAPDQCVLLWEEDPYGRAMSLDAAVKTVWDEPFGAVVVCKPGRLAYYATNDGEEHWILQRSTRD